MVDEELVETPQRWTARRRAALVLSLLRGETSAAEAAKAGDRFSPPTSTTKQAAAATAPWRSGPSRRSSRRRRTSRTRSG